MCAWRFPLLTCTALPPANINKTSAATAVDAQPSTSAIDITTRMSDWLWVVFTIILLWVVVVIV
ncbi:hypothetical protein CALVIDRAFT_540383 [Calocera viscosa TUFC12733]|uniref:Uncharacterized protein n=1 Tax=Calocera viscosa (strain TUFC12733) TaxID=1330018 RepID=A0A167J1D3_CALVF|nr:hypothetical protein CALVIDRAFT_540383 [Calocera viscosa TUFC12733]